MSMILMAQIEPIRASMPSGAVLITIAYLGAIVYLLSLAARFVRAVENIAEKLDQK